MCMRNMLCYVTLRYVTYLHKSVVIWVFFLSAFTLCGHTLQDLDSSSNHFQAFVLITVHKVTYRLGDVVHRLGTSGTRCEGEWKRVWGREGQGVRERGAGCEGERDRMWGKEGHDRDVKGMEERDRRRGKLKRERKRGG